MAAALVKHSNLCRGESFRSKTNKNSIFYSSFSNYLRFKRMNNSEVITMKSKDLSLIFDKSHSNTQKYKIRGESADVFHYKKTGEKDEKVNGRVNADMLDRWIEQSIQEIVKNIGEAPFLMQIYSQGSSQLKLKKEEVSPNSWPVTKKRWDESNSTPDGIILVEQLKDEEVLNDEALNMDDNSNDGSKTWGLVVQGRGMDCAASCYILNTCRVKSTAGFCTHFCLIRAKFFGESLGMQLHKAWLQ